MKVLVTGFGPFKDFDINPSALLVEGLEMDRVIIRKEIFDVSRADIEGRYSTILNEFQPDFILNIGLNASSGGLNLETFAINSLKDKAAFSTIKKEWGYQSKIDTSELADILCKDGIPAIRSDYAGSYYCNFIYFLSLEWCKNNGGAALFLHIPFTKDLASEISLRKKVIYPSLPKETMLKGIKKIITHLDKNKTTVS
jgi:pyrrolidone-carboxylate peptidase